MAVTTFIKNVTVMGVPALSSPVMASGPRRALRGTLRMVMNEGDEYKIVFGGAVIPEAVMRMGQQDALGLLAGTLNAQAAVFSGRIRIDSGMSFLMSLERFL